MADNIKSINKTKVDSSNLDWVAYDEKRKELFIMFKSGGLYVYFDVPKEVYSNLLSASSKGHYHHVNIKWKYRYEKLN